MRLRHPQVAARSGSVVAASAALLIGLIPIGTGHLSVASAQVRSAPRLAGLSISPVSGRAGTTVSLGGTGYASATASFTPTVTVAFTDANGVKTTLPQTTTINATGAFALAVTVPSTAATGPALFSATDISGTAVSAPFDVRPGVTSINAAQQSLAPGATTTLTGNGFAVNQPITVTYIQGISSTVLSSGVVTTTSSGLFTTTVTVPGSAPSGVATLQVQDRDSNSATAPLVIVRNGAPTVALSSASGAPGTTVSVNGSNFAVSQPVSVTFNEGTSTLGLISGTVSTDVNGAFTGTVTIPSSAVTGTATLTATDASGNSGGTPYTIAYPYNANNGPTSLYFAEGFTGQYSTNGKASYDETLSILNANPFTATVAITYLVQSGSPVVVTRSVGPNSALRESVNSDIGPDQTAAAIVYSPSRITAERLIRRTGAGGVTLGANTSLGNPNLGTTFYFAEGYTGISYQEYLTVANPGNSAAHVTVTYAPQASTVTTPVTQTFTVPAHGRDTENIRRITAGLANKSVGMIVTSDAPIMAERVLYFGDGNGSGKYGSTAQAGLQSAATQYLFAYGSAGGTGLAQRPGDQSYVTVLNPGLSPTPATIVAQFYDVNGHALGSTSVVVAPGTRQTITANLTVGNTSAIYSTVLSSATPFVAEKPQYFGGTPNAGTHPGVDPSGAPTGVKSAAFPDLSLTDPSGALQQQTVFLYNPTTAPITVTGTYYATSGSKSVVYSIPANSIVTVNVNTDAVSLPGGALGGIFTVTSSGTNDSFVATNIANTADGRSYTGTQGSLSAQ